MAGRRFCIVITFILIFPHRTFGYEKTLRKIVRNQSKMVQRPFSDAGAQTWSWNNHSGAPQKVDGIIATGFTQTKVLHRVQRPKMSTLLATSEHQRRGNSAHSKMLPKNNAAGINDLRTARNTIPIKDHVLQPFTGNRNQADQNHYNDTSPARVTLDPYQIPAHSKFFPPVEDQDLQSIEQKNSKEQTVVFPESPDPKDNSSIYLKSMFIANKNDSNRISNQPSNSAPLEAQETPEGDKDKEDYLLNGTPLDVGAIYSYNASIVPYVCNKIIEAEADIKTQNKYASFDIEPDWASQKHYWNNIFDSRYESLMVNIKWPPLEVILVPRSQVDSIWKKTFDQYHKDSVSKILANIVKKLQFYINMTFSWNEVSHLSRWWRNTSTKSRAAFRKLVKSGRIEITTGGWVETDEATTHIFGLVHQLVQGHEWLKEHLNYSPKTAWLTNTVAHSPTMTYLLSALDISQVVLTNLHFSWEQYLAEYQYSDFIWIQNWDNDKSQTTKLNEELGTIGTARHPRHSVLTHYLQFNSAGFKACGPKTTVCVNDYNFAKLMKNLYINTYNIKEKSEILLEQYSKSGTISTHNTIIAPIGAPYAYENQPDFDYQYNNYQRIADFVNANRDTYKATIQFGTPKDYFKSILSKYKKYPTVKGDFVNFADVSSGTPGYWAGYFTSRPIFKILLRRLESTMRTTEILFSFALGLNVFREFDMSHIYRMLIKCRETLARLMDRNVVSGTLPMNVLRYTHTLILKTVKDCWLIQEFSASLLTSKKGTYKPYLQKYVYREGEFISTFKTVSPEDQIYIFNSLSHERTEIIELVTRRSNVRIVDYKRKDVTVQINPIWKYTAQNTIKISRRFFKIIFAVVIPPMTIELFKIKTTYDASQSAAIIYCSSCEADDESGGETILPFIIQPIQTGDIQLESYKHRLIFEEATGFLKTVIEKETNIAKTVVIDFSTFREADVNSGMFLFNTNVTKPLNDILRPYRIGAKNKITMIISGRITTEMSSVFGRFLQHTIKIFNLVHGPLSNAIYIESKVDYEISPKNRDLEVFMSIQTDIANGSPPQIYMDNNGFQYTNRVLNISRRIESNTYPITSMAYLQDHKSRLTYITDHAQGVTAMQEGQLVVILDRRVLFNDGRGSGEGLADNSATYHRQYILLENIKQNEDVSSGNKDISLPSLPALYLSNALNYLQDIFLVNQNATSLCHYGFLPLIKTSFPCDMSVINFRVVLTGVGDQVPTPSTTLLILHKRSFSCKVDTSLHLRCNGEEDFSLDNIIRNVRGVFLTNLAGTNKGTPLYTFSRVNFNPMELVTLRVYF